MNGGGGWGVFNALLGWQNSATYGSVISYNLYWMVMIVVFISLRFKETHGHWPLLKRKAVPVAEIAGSGSNTDVDSESDSARGVHFENKHGAKGATTETHDHEKASSRNTLADETRNTRSRVTALYAPEGYRESWRMAEVDRTGE